MSERTLRLSTIEAEILRLLIANGEMYGLQLVNGSEMLKRGTVYVTLGRMEDKGLVTSRTEKSQHESGMPRRLFVATGAGAQVFKAWQMATAAFREAFA